MQKTKSKNFYLSVFIFILVSFLFYLHHKKYIDLLGFNKKPADMLFEKCNDKMANDLCAIMGTSPNFSPEVNQIYLPSYGTIRCKSLPNTFASRSWHVPVD